MSFHFVFQNTCTKRKPIARVLPLLNTSYLDKEFDYLVPEEQSFDAKPGVRVQVRFRGKLVNAYIINRLSHTNYKGKLNWVENIISSEPVLTPEIWRLVNSVAAYYAGTRADVLRLAIPPRKVQAEKHVLKNYKSISSLAIDTKFWDIYKNSRQLLKAISQKRAARAVWQALPGEKWAIRMIEAAVVAINAGLGVLAVVPDQNNIDILYSATSGRLPSSRVVTLSANLGPSVRYQRWLSVLRGYAKLVIGTRSAVFAPVLNLGLILMWNDGDDNFSELRAPYPHTRSVAILRAHQLPCAAIIGGYIRTTEAQSLIRSSWAYDLVASRKAVRISSPYIFALENKGSYKFYNPLNYRTRLPSIALKAARSSLYANHPVLIQVPRCGYVPLLACGKCRTVMRCRRCTGSLSILDEINITIKCKWCGETEPKISCIQCGSSSVRAVILGVRRTAEELGRAFPGTSVIISAEGRIIRTIKDFPALVVSTPGAEPMAENGYGAALLLDAWTMLGRQNLRAAEDTLRKWMTAVAMVKSRANGGVVVVVAESNIGSVQALIRWDPIWHASAELDNRSEVKFPPAVHMAAIDGITDKVSYLVKTAQLPNDAEILGPLELPLGVRRPPWFEPSDKITRTLIRVSKKNGLELAIILKRTMALIYNRNDQKPCRIQINPINIG